MHIQSKNTKVLLIGFVITLAASGLALGQDSVAVSVEPSALHALETGGIAERQKVNVEGIIINRHDQSFTVRDAKGTETVVVVNDKTVIKKERKGWFHRDKSSSSDDIRCGLRLKVEGEGNSDGQLVAKNITIDEPDLKTAETLESRVDLFEEFANSTPDQTRITETGMRLDQAEQNAATLWTIQTVEHCGKCSSFYGDCAASCRGHGGCPGRGGCNQNE